MLANRPYKKLQLNCPKNLAILGKNGDVCMKDNIEIFLKPKNSKLLKEYYRPLNVEDIEQVEDLNSMLIIV